MILTTLADVARRTGHKVVEVDNWQNRGHGHLRAVKTVVFHHTAGPKGRVFPSYEVLVKGRPDLEGPLCNYGIDREGTIYVIAGGLAYHAGKTHEPEQGNTYSIGIEVEHCGTKDEEWSEPVLSAMRCLGQELCKEYGLPLSRIMGHKEIAAPKGRKIDPFGLDMDSFRTSCGLPAPRKGGTGTRLFLVTGAVGAGALAAAFGLNAGQGGTPADPTATVTPGTVITATTAPTSDVPVVAVPTVTVTVPGPTVTVTSPPVSAPVSGSTSTLRFGSKGESVKALQRKLGIAADGSYGRRTLLAVERAQRANNLKADGIVGPATRKALGL